MPGEAVEITSGEVGGDAPDERRRRPLRWFWLTGLGGLVAAVATALVSPRIGGSFVVLFGIDSYGWSFLLGGTAALLTLIFFSVLTHRLLWNRRGWVAGLLEPLAMLLLLAILLVGLPLGLVAGALSFKNSYRDIGRVDGHAIVVQQFAGWDTDDMLDAGYREGPFVLLRATGDYYLDRPPTTIDSWQFSTTTTPTTVSVRYRAGEQPHQAGVLTFPRHGSEPARATAR